MIMKTIMIAVRQLCQPFAAVCHGKLRGDKLFTWLQAPGKVTIVNPHHQPGLMELIHFRLHMESAAIKERESKALSHILSGILICQYHERIMLMAGCAPGASQIRYAMKQRRTLHLTFPGMPSIKMNQIHAVMIHVQAARQRFMEPDFPFRLIFYDRRSSNNVILFKHAIQQMQIQLFLAVLQHNFQGVNQIFLCSKHSWKPLQGVFAMPHAEAVKKQQAVADAFP